MAAHAQKASLKDLQQITVEENPGIRAAFSQWYASLKQQTVAGALPDPSLAFGYFVSPVETRLGPQEYRAGVSQQVPWFGTLKFRSKVAESQARVDFYRLVHKSNSVMNQLTIAYYEAWLAGKMQDIHEEQLKWLMAQKNWIEQRYRNGSKSQADVVRIKMAIDRQKETIAMYKDEQKAKKIRVNKIANRQPNATILFRDSIGLKKTGTFPDIREMELDSINPELQVLKHKQIMMQNSSIAAARSNYPAFNIGAEYIAVGERTDMNVSGSGNDAVMAKVSLKLPVNIRKNKARVAVQDFEAEKFYHLYQERKNELYTKVVEIQTSYQDAFRKYELAVKQAEDARYVESLLRSDYATGMTDYDEWMKIRREMLEYQQTSFRNKVEMLKIDAERRMIFNQFDVEESLNNRAQE